MTDKKTNRKQLIGQVISSSMDKTVVVKVERKYPHKKYNKYINKTKKYYAHDPLNTCNVGDSISIEESRPISKLKRWKVIKTLNKAIKI